VYFILLGELDKIVQSFRKRTRKEEERMPLELLLVQPFFVLPSFVYFVLLFFKNKI
jgi:hypothetical protein